MSIASQETIDLAKSEAKLEARPRPFRITIDFYERMIAAGLLDKLPVFLWKGQLLEKMTKGRKHNHAAAGLTAILVRSLPPGWHVRVQQPVLMGNDTAPEPDFAIVRGSLDDYVDRDVRAGDVSLIVEVADSSLGFDRETVLETYSRESIPVYWIVNIPERTIDVYTVPSGASASGPPHYSRYQSYSPGQEVPLLLDGQQTGAIPVVEILR